MHLNSNIDQVTNISLKKNIDVCNSRTLHCYYKLNDCFYLIVQFFVVDVLKIFLIQIF